MAMGADTFCAPSAPLRLFFKSPSAAYRKLISKINTLDGAARGIRTPDPIITNDVKAELQPMAT
jgi:hypothetical protein